MTNTTRLQEYIRKSGIKMSSIADRLDISRYTLSNKINNKNEFKAGEILGLCDILSIDEHDMKSVFFAHR